MLGGTLLLSSCVSMTLEQTAALIANPPADLPAVVEHSDVPFYPQTRDHCGPAALATVLRHVGFSATPEQLSDTVFLPAREGTLQTEMLTGARRAGAVAVRLPPQLDALLRELAAGHAVVILQNLGLSFAPLWHYAVVIGYDTPNHQLLLRSGSTERERMSWRTFEHTWARSGRWAFVALRPGQLPAMAREDDAVQGVLGFERVAPPDQAVQAWDGVLARWPHSLVAAMGVGNARMAAGDAAGAAAAFDAAARAHDSAAAWNNLAEARLALGQREAARAAARRAVARAEQAEPAWLDATRQTLARVGP
ncbi:MAG: PA2778 family cysteine peptidase [Burkholderiales bacterium]